MQENSIFSQLNGVMDWMVKLVEQMAQVVPLEMYALLGSFLEEIFSPIPSPLVMTLAGTLSAAAQKPFMWMIVLALLSAVGKVAAMWIIYVFVDKVEDLVVGKLGKYIGVSSESLENIGKMFAGTWKDEAIIFFTRAIPVMPSTPLSVLAGLIKLPLKSYLVWSFIGTFVRSMIFLYIGYEGLTGSLELLDGEGSVGLLLKLGSVALLGVFVLAVFLQREKRDLFVVVSDHLDKLSTRLFGQRKK